MAAELLASATAKFHESWAQLGGDSACKRAHESWTWLGGDCAFKWAAPVALYVCAVAGFLSLATLILPWLRTFLFTRQDLKTRYNATWALVTGGSSGIGLSLCRQLAAQGINVVMVAYPDVLLKKSAAELAREYPNISVRSVGADLSRQEGYMPDLEKATADIPVQLVFNNAGYIVTGFFADTALEKWLGNLNCNATAAIVITHHFLGRMRAAGLRGAIAFTSSPANIIPSPFSTLYGATKSLMTHFACSLACEITPDGIDVAVLHPSPVSTRFYQGTHALPTLQLFKSTATGPDGVAATLLRSLGRTVVVDQG